MNVDDLFHMGYDVIRYLNRLVGSKVVPGTSTCEPLRATEWYLRFVCLIFVA